MGLSVQWLGQAGFAVQAASGELCLIDPYLSDYLRDEMNIPRIAPIVRDPLQTRATVCMTSHWHADHLDPVTCKALVGANPDLLFVGPPANTGRLAAWRVRGRNLVPLDRGQSVAIGPFRITGVFARHEVPGMICEDALTYVIEVDGVRLFHSGDTEYDARIRRAVRSIGPIDLGLFSIPGTGGNMNAVEAALLASQLGPSVAVPMHYGMWAPAGYGASDDPGTELPTLDPHLFVDTYARLGGGESRILAIGETIDVRKA